MELLVNKKTWLLVVVCLLLIGSSSFAVNKSPTQNHDVEDQAELFVDRIWFTGVASPWTYYLTPNLSCSSFALQGSIECRSQWRPGAPPNYDTHSHSRFPACRTNILPYENDPLYWILGPTFGGSFVTFCGT